MVMSSTKNANKTLFFVIIICLCIAILSVIIFFFSKSSQERILATVINQTFTWPNSKLENELDNIRGGTLIGKGVPSQENELSSIEVVLEKMYGRYFTDDSFKKFCRERIPLEYLLFAKQKNYKVSLKKLESKQSKDTVNYYLFSTELLVEHEDGKKEIVIENGTVLFNTAHKIENITISRQLLQVK